MKKRNEKEKILRGYRRNEGHALLLILFLSPFPLLKSGAAVNGPGCPLRMALSLGKIEIAYFLFQRGATVFWREEKKREE